MDEDGNCSHWSREENKKFENALAVYYSKDQDDPDWWEKIAADIPGKTLDEIKYHYQLLVDDIDEIESGRMPVPRYSTGSSVDFDVGRVKNKFLLVSLVNIQDRNKNGAKELLGPRKNTDVYSMRVNQIIDEAAETRFNFYARPFHVH